jgi:hypothetical protein
MTMGSYDLCLTWNWEYDADFVKLLGLACRSRGLSLLQITPGNLVEMVQSLANEEVVFRTFFDRAADADPRFIPVVQWACGHAVHHINSHELACRAWDKVTMHQAISMGLDTPFTLILPSYDEQPLLPEIDLASVGQSFIIKPAYGGGGDGVIIEATSLNQVVVARQEFPSQRYLLQAHVTPARLGSRMAWFRVVYCAGKVYPCWWDNGTHIYAPVISDEEICYHLGALRRITSSIARMCGLELFSTEITFTPEGRFVIVDYVNDPIDLRLQSKAFDGVPDDIVRDIAECLAELILSHSSPSQSQSFIRSITPSITGSALKLAGTE